MKTAFVILYLISNSRPAVEVPQRFASMEECRASASGMQGILINANKNWRDDANLDGMLAVCVPVMQN